MPTSDDDIIKIVENSSMIIALRRDIEAEEAEKNAFASLKGCVKGAAPLLETRHYYIDVKRCELDLAIRDKGSKYKPVTGKSTLFKSWSMRYTKTRRHQGKGGGQPGKDRSGEGTPEGKWTNQITMFVMNGENIVEREKMCAILHHYHTASTHAKSHTMGNSLSDRILQDDRIKKVLSESTWTTTQLHYGLQYGSMGPMTHPRRAHFDILRICGFYLHPITTAEV